MSKSLQGKRLFDWQFFYAHFPLKAATITWLLLNNWNVDLWNTPLLFSHILILPPAEVISLRKSLGTYWKYGVERAHIITVLCIGLLFSVQLLKDRKRAEAVQQLGFIPSTLSTVLFCQAHRERRIFSKFLDIIIFLVEAIHHNSFRLQSCHTYLKLTYKKKWKECHFIKDVF